MIIKFVAEAVEVEENDLEVLTVGFYTEENYLMIQYSLDIEDSNYHIERDDQSYGGYGGVEKITFTPDQIEVELDEIGKENLACEGVMVYFDSNEKTFQLLSEKLKLIFGDLLTVKN